MNYNEKDILRQLCNPETQQKAFSVVVKQYSEQLYWQIRRMVLSHDDANDVLQNVFVKAWVNLSDFQGRSKLSTWLYRIAINEALDFLRRQKTQGSITSGDDQEVAQRLLADDYFDGVEAQALLQEAIARLPDVQRTVFLLRYYEEMKYSEMSKQLGTSEGALKASYHLAVKKITDYLAAHE